MHLAVIRNILQHYSPGDPRLLKSLEQQLENMKAGYARERGEQAAENPTPSGDSRASNSDLWLYTEGRSEVRNTEDEKNLAETKKKVADFLVRAKRDIIGAPSDYEAFSKQSVEKAPASMLPAYQDVFIQALLRIAAISRTMLIQYAGCSCLFYGLISMRIAVPYYDHLPRFI